jgi:hypothetical protein
MKDVSAGSVLAHILSTKERVSNKQLNQYWEKIREKDPTIYPDITSNSLCHETERNPDLFRIVDDFTYGRNPDAKEYFTNGKITHEFDYKLDKKTIDILISAASEIYAD